jgi:hypothetical protein
MKMSSRAGNADGHGNTQISKLHGARRRKRTGRGKRLSKKLGGPVWWSRCIAT